MACDGHIVAKLSRAARAASATHEQQGEVTLVGASARDSRLGICVRCASVFMQQGSLVVDVDCTSGMSLQSVHCG